jgi:hypothetical protein
MKILKLKPIAEEILRESVERPTWGEVKQIFAAVIGKQNKSDATSALKSIGKIGLSIATSATGVSALIAAVETVGKISDMKDVALGLFTLGKSLTTAELKNPKSSEFKQLTAPFWDAVRLTPEVSMLLDDKIETQFINQVILPNLKKGGNDNDEIPNMDEELGKWLNEMGLKDKADIHFKGKEGDL